MKHFYFSWKKSRLQKKLETFRELIQIMNYTQTGHTVLNQFEEFNKTLDIKVEFKPYPREIITKINSANGDMRPVGASFVTNGKSGVIYFDYRNELGILALQFIHEMVHAMDLNLWSLAKELQAGKTENKSDLIQKSEISAYQIQNQFLKELSIIDSTYHEYLKTKYPDSLELHTEYNEAQIQEKYGQNVIAA